MRGRCGSGLRRGSPRGGGLRGGWLRGASLRGGWLRGGSLGGGGRRGWGAEGAEQSRVPPDDQEGGCKADHDRSQQKTREDACLLQSHSLMRRKAAFICVYNAPAIFFAKHCGRRRSREV